MKTIIKTLATITLTAVALKVMKRAKKNITLDVNKSYIDDDLIKSAKIVGLGFR